MFHFLRKTWSDILHPMLRRPPRLQVAALCLRGAGDRRQVLLITSRDTGRWVLPKGWPMEGRDGAGAALQEAWEEAGVEGHLVGRDPVGRYHYDKGLKGGLPVLTETLVYEVAVRDLADDYPECNQRNRRWVAPVEAATMVNEPELRDLLAAL